MLFKDLQYFLGFKVELQARKFKNKIPGQKNPPFCFLKNLYDFQILKNR